MSIVHEQVGQADVFRVSGRIDSSNAGDLENAMIAPIQEGRVTNLVVNLKDVTFLSSAALRALVAALVRTQNNKPAGALVLSDVRPEVYEVFVLGAFTSLFSFFTDEASAVASFPAAE